MEKVLTISIAAYNVSKYLATTLESLIVNNLNKLDIIVVNDGSRDDTSVIAHDYAKCYPDSIRVVDKENGGYGSTINTSLAIARGKYFKLLDGDDWFDMESLPQYISFLEQTDADLVVNPYYEVRKERRIVANHQNLTAGQIENISISNHMFCMHELAVKTERLRSLNSFRSQNGHRSQESLRSQYRLITEKCFYTDTEYTYNAIRCSDTITYFDIAVYCYRLGLAGQSVSIEGNRKHYKDYVHVLKRISEYYEADSKIYTGTKLAILGRITEHITFATYFAYLLLESPRNHRQELLNLDNCILQNYPNAYQCGMGSNIVKVLRSAHFCFIPFMCWYAMIKWRRDNQ